MAKDETRRLKPADLANDLALYAALKDVEGYAPANPAYSLPSLLTLYTKRLANEEADVQAAAAAASARDTSVGSQWDFHNGMLGAKDQVIAQYGLDSNEVQAMNLKKKSEYKRPTRKAKVKS
jgi:hypothetical protein